MSASVSPPAPAAGGKPHAERAHWQWPAVAAAALVATCLSGAIGWLTIGRGQAEGMAPIADRPLAEEKATQAPTAARRFAPAVSSPEETPEPPHLMIESALGVVLVSDNENGAWRVVPAQFPLKDPARFLSLAESWVTVDIPDVAKLVVEGTTEIGLAQRMDGVIEVRLERGHFAIQGLREGVEIRVLTGPATWTVRGLTGDSTLAVMFDPSSPGIAVPRGQIAIDNAPLDTRQLLRWCNGALSPDHHAQPAHAAGEVAMPVVNAWDLDWLAPPDRSRQQQWRSDYGGLVDRLAAANDWRAELNRLLATTSDKRHVALLAQWTTTTEPPAKRASRLFSMLGESRLAVRIAAVTCLLELPAGDRGREDFLALLQNATDETTRGQVTEWLDATRQAWPLSQVQALQLKSCLTHRELAVRQIAVSLLELHTTTALLQAGQRSPAFDAAGPATSWTAAQQEWEALLGQLFTADSNLTHLPGNGSSEPPIIRALPVHAREQSASGSR
jgi:hypothetical protein